MSAIETMSFEDMRRLIVYVCLNKEETAARCAAMISILDKREAASDPVPGYVELLKAAEAMA